jgi:hypothetical protein
MEIQATSSPPADTQADTIVIGVFDGEEPSHPALAALVESGEAKRSHGSLALTH